MLALAVIIPLLAVLVPIAIAFPLVAVDTWEKWDERRKIRKEYDRIIDNWKKLALTEKDQTQKGFEVAVLCNIAYEKNTLYPKGMFMK
jgi:hypothetical protein